MKRHCGLLKSASVLCLLLVVSAGWAQAPKRTLKPNDYGLWEMLSFAKLSNDGRWFAYAASKIEGDRRMVIRNVDSPQQVEVPNAVNAEFSEDSKWVAYTIGPSRKEADEARQKKQPFEPKLVLKNLASGEERTYEAVQQFRFLKTSKFLLVGSLPSQPAKEGGSDLTVVNLETGAQLVIGNVANLASNESGTCVALEIDSGGKYGGVQLLDPATSSLKTAYWGKEGVTGLTWAKKSDTLAFFVGKDDDKKEGPWNVFALVTAVQNAAPAIAIVDPAKLDGFPKDYRIAEFAGLDLSDDGKSVVFGIRKWEDKKKPVAGNPEDKPDVDVWHYKDIDPQPLQQKQASRERMKTLACLWKEGKFVQIEDEKFDRATVLKGHAYAYGPDKTPYDTPVKVGGLVFADWYIVNLANGTRAKILDKTQWPVFGSGEGKYLTYYKEKNWWLYDLAKGTHTNLTGKLGVSFEDVEYDGPQKEKPYDSVPVWLAGDKGVLLYDQFDLWMADPATGKVVKWTNGRADKISFRAVDVYRDSDAIDLNLPIYFRAFNEDTKASGIAMRSPDGAFKMLAMDDSATDLLQKAKNADRMLFSYQTFEKSPNVFVTNGLVEQAKPLTKTNPQQENFLWGKTELVRYKSAWGKELAGTLIYPADYKKGGSYPMVTLIYERQSDGLNRYRPPVERDSYNVQVLSQNGYFVFLPDIAYRLGEPGVSAVQCLEPAVAAVLQKHVGVDPRRVGLMGHSWGAYQTAYAVTVSKAFAVGVAGAPLTDLVSMYDSFYWNSGESNQVIFESSQGRMAGPWWEDMKSYMDNSPIYQAGKMNKPLLIAFGDQDGAVDWRQGQYLYSALRRMGKFIIMLVYPGENHGLARKGNQLDYAHRLRHFFDVYLKGAKPEPWITEGVPFSKKNP
jgi:dienelactone hydrolase